MLHHYLSLVGRGCLNLYVSECEHDNMGWHHIGTSKLVLMHFMATKWPQKLIYQEHLATGLIIQYNTRSQQIDQLIHDASFQIQKHCRIMCIKGDVTQSSQYLLALLKRDKTIRRALDKSEVICAITQFWHWRTPITLGTSIARNKSKQQCTPYTCISETFVD